MAMEKLRLRVYAKRSKAGEQFMVVEDGKVCCNGKRNDEKTKFIMYRGGEIGTTVAFEYTMYYDEKPIAMMLCVGEDNMLSAKEQTTRYNNFKDIEKEFLFGIGDYNERNEFKLFWGKENDGKYIGFVRSSDAFQLCIVDSKSKAENFSLDH